VFIVVEKQQQQQQLQQHTHSCRLGSDCWLCLGFVSKPGVHKEIADVPPA